MGRRNPYRARGRMKGIAGSKERERLKRGGTNTAWLWIIGFVTLPIGIGVIFILTAIIIEIRES